MINAANAMTPTSAGRLAGGIVAGDTWGVSGPQFLAWYAVLGAAALGTAVVLLRRTNRGNGVPPMDAHRLTPTQIALLTDDSLVAVVALAQLRRRDLIDARGRRTGSLTSDGGLDEVTRAVYRELKPDATVKARTALGRGNVQRAVRHAASQLRKGGHLTDHGPGYAKACCRAVVPLVAVIGLGVARAAAGSTNHKPVSFLILMLCVLIVAVPVLPASVPSRLTAAGKSALRELRTEQDHLRPAHRPSWSTYGRDAVVLSVALFGGAALVAAEPDFAQAVGAKAVACGDGGGGAGGDGGGGCGGGGCGGGCGG